MGNTNKQRFASLLTLALVLAANCLGAAKHDFQTAKLLDVTTDTKLVDGSPDCWRSGSSVPSWR